jgi:pyruvate dehydrogenase E1 component alpha subunit
MGPTLMECRTFRMTGHSAHDDAGYVPKELFEEWEKKDPVPRYQQILIQEEIVTSAEIDQLQRQIVKEVDLAVDWAEKSPFPDPEECLTDVYAD